MNHIATGDKGEQSAASYLSKLGYTIIATKYRAKTGEIDIIAKDKDCLVFVEVKTRRSTIYGFPAEAVNFRKQQKIINTALCFFNQRGITDCACRFDILEVYLTKESIQCNHIINAFGK
ncbi:YraN family protein [Sporomusa sp. KB1]|jgi:putative endonuclease|uniref:YraN family protein n=1 Tax=Sporomusa sp. KB1 TaxID=943346 RepID=UPI0011A71B0E|nr:YraN family protein [Sporomusa sp. KB1]TWH48458.1 putative endonuclease [Sporomusa sp. KB1]